MATLAPLLALDLAALAERLAVIPAARSNGIPAIDLRSGDDLIIPPELWDAAPAAVQAAVSDACAIRNVRPHVAPFPFLARVRGAPA